MLIMLTCIKLIQVYTVCEARNCIAFRKKTTLQLTGLETIVLPVCLVACSMPPCLLILNEEIDVVRFTDDVCRVDMATGSVDLVWLVEKNITAMAMTSRGLLAASWRDKVIEYTTDGRLIASYQIPTIYGLSASETIPMANGIY